MTGQASAGGVPSRGEARDEAAALLDAFDSRKIVYLNARGERAEGPRSLRDRISHALLFELKSSGQKEAGEFLERWLAALQSQGAWTAAEKLASSVLGEAPGRTAFSVLHEALVELIEHEVVRLNAEAPAPDWNTEARASKTEYAKKLRAIEEREAALLSGEELRAFREASRGIVQSEASPVLRVARLVAEEEKAWASIDRLLAESASHPQKEEIYGVVAEKIQPPMGIVTHLSPALFFPSLRLLADPRVDISSGIPYMASVNLSIYRDPALRMPSSKPWTGFPSPAPRSGKT